MTKYWHHKGVEILERLGLDYVELSLDKKNPDILRYRAWRIPRPSTNGHKKERKGVVRLDGR
jgi:hypothetical protein